MRALATSRLSVGPAAGARDAAARGAPSVGSPAAAFCRRTLVPSPQARYRAGHPDTLGCRQNTPAGLARTGAVPLAAGLRGAPEPPDMPFLPRTARGEEVAASGDA